MFNTAGRFKPKFHANFIDENLALIRSPKKQSAIRGGYELHAEDAALDESTDAKSPLKSENAANDNDDDSLQSRTVSCGRIKFLNIPVPETAPTDLICEECEKNFSAFYCGRCQQLFCSRCADLCHPAPYGEAMHFHEADGHIRAVQPGDRSSIKVDDTFHLPDTEFHEEDFLKVRDLTLPNSLSSVTAREGEVALARQSKANEQAPKYDVHQIVLFNDPVKNVDAYGKIISQYDFRHTISAPPVIRTEGSAVCYIVQLLGYTDGIEDLTSLIPRETEIVRDTNYPVLEGIEQDPNRVHLEGARRIQKRIDDVEGIKRLGPKHHLRDIVTYGKYKAEHMHQHHNDKVHVFRTGLEGVEDQIMKPQQFPFPMYHDQQSVANDSSSTTTDGASSIAATSLASGSSNTSIHPSSMYSTQFALQNIQQEKYRKVTKTLDARHAVLKKMDYSPQLYDKVDISLYADVDTDLQSQMSAANREHDRPFPAVVRSYEDLLLHPTAQSLQHQHHGGLQYDADYFPAGTEYLPASGHALHGLAAEDIINTVAFTRNAMKVFVLGEALLQSIAERIDETIGKKTRKFGKVLNLRMITERMYSVAKAFERWIYYTTREREIFEFHKIVRVQAHVRRFLNRFTIRKLEEGRLAAWDQQWQELHSQFKYTTADDPYAVTMDKKLYFQTLADVNRYAATLRVVLAKLGKYLLRKRNYILGYAVKTWKAAISTTFEEKEITYSHFHELAIDPEPIPGENDPHEFIQRQRDVITAKHAQLQQRVRLVLHRDDTVTSQQQQQQSNLEASGCSATVLKFDDSAAASSNLYNEMSHDNALALPLRLPNVRELPASVAPQLSRSEVAHEFEDSNMSAPISASNNSFKLNAPVINRAQSNISVATDSTVTSASDHEEQQLSPRAAIRLRQQLLANAPIGTIISSSITNEVNPGTASTVSVASAIEAHVPTITPIDGFENIRVATALEQSTVATLETDLDDGGSESIEPNPSALTIDTSASAAEAAAAERHNQLVPAYSPSEDMKSLLPELPRIFIPHSAEGRLQVKSERRLDYCDFRNLMKGPTFDSCWVIQQLLAMGSMPWGTSDESNSNYPEGTSCKTEEFATALFTRKQLIDQKISSNRTVTGKIAFKQPKSQSRLSSITALLLSGVDYFVSLLEVDEEREMEAALGVEPIATTIHKALDNAHHAVSKIVMFNTDKINVQQELLEEIPEYGKTDPRFEKAYRERLRIQARIELARDNIRGAQAQVKNLPLRVDFVRLSLRRDGSGVNVNNLLPLLWLLEKLLAEGRRLYLYSSDGRGRSGLMSALLLGRVYHLRAYEALYRIQCCHDSAKREELRQIPITCPQLPVHRKLVTELLDVANRFKEGIHFRTQLDPDTFVDHYANYQMISEAGGQRTVSRLRTPVNSIRAITPTVAPEVRAEAEAIGSAAVAAFGLRKLQPQQQHQQGQISSKEAAPNRRYSMYRALSEKRLPQQEVRSVEDQRAEIRLNIAHGNNLVVQEAEQKFVDAFSAEENKRKFNIATMQKGVDYDVVARTASHQYGSIRSSTLSDNGSTGTGTAKRHSGGGDGRRLRREAMSSRTSHSSSHQQQLEKGAGGVGKSFNTLNMSLSASTDSNSAAPFAMIQASDSNDSDQRFAGIAPPITRVASVEPLLESVEEAAIEAESKKQIRQQQEQIESGDSELFSPTTQQPSNPRLQEPSIGEMYDPAVFGQSMNVVRRLAQRRPQPADRPNLQQLRTKQTPAAATHKAPGLTIRTAPAAAPLLTTSSATRAADGTDGDIVFQLASKTTK